ncbi:Stonustoxin subunit alpha [Labeo rohita]|uniref:Stonustoxin subunit alpha n=1 Tax=Labeo rohita TaxID=84645 RepID=A0ABQ8L877_LABRO|nr:Stonustoxin subunit alpha [Labeo rohita]
MNEQSSRNQSASREHRKKALDVHLQLNVLGCPEEHGRQFSAEKPLQPTKLGWVEDEGSLIMNERSQEATTTRSTRSGRHPERKCALLDAGLSRDRTAAQACTQVVFIVVVFVKGMRLPIYIYPSMFAQIIHDPASLDQNVDHGGESRITAGLKKYACFLTLDPNTTNNYLRLSEENRKVTGVRVCQSYPDHPDRFAVHRQVLCRESVCGRCYWEIKWSGRVCISVSYKSISRNGRGDECRFGYNDQSWSLICSCYKYSFRHNNEETDLPVKSTSNRIRVSDIISRRQLPDNVSVMAVCDYDDDDDDDDDDYISRTRVYNDADYIRRIRVYKNDDDDDEDDDHIRRTGVYVDVSAGTLSFYSVSDTMRLIHKVQTTFTQTLYSGFTLWSGSVKLC